MAWNCFLFFFLLFERFTIEGMGSAEHTFTKTDPAGATQRDLLDYFFNGGLKTKTDL